MSKATEPHAGKCLPNVYAYIVFSLCLVTCAMFTLGVRLQKGASPVEVDSGRGMRPEQWAKFCGRYSCAEMIEKCARSRLLEKTSSCKWSNDSLALDKPAVSRSRTNPSQQQSGGEFSC